MNILHLLLSPTTMNICPLTVHSAKKTLVTGLIECGSVWGTGRFGFIWLENTEIVPFDLTTMSLSSDMAPATTGKLDLTLTTLLGLIAVSPALSSMLRGAKVTCSWEACRKILLSTSADTLQKSSLIPTQPALTDGFLNFRLRPSKVAEELAQLPFLKSPQLF